MCGLSHYIEAEGIATAGISLVREHTEKMRPPRALWVPFPLGRPFGAPGEPDFQIDVLRALLRVFEAPSGPVIVDYPDDAPAMAPDDEPWACALPLPPLDPATTAAGQLTQALLTEVNFLLPWYGESKRRRGRTLFGLSGLTVDDASAIAAFLAAYAAGETPSLPGGLNGALPAAIRPLVDDMRTLYLEAGYEQPAALRPTAQELNAWFYRQTRLGDVLYRIRDRIAADAPTDSQGRPINVAIIPNAFRQRPPAAHP